MPHTGTRQVLQHGTAEAAGADDQHATLGEFGLAGRPDFLEKQLP
jgi:hypothetical protein